MLNKNVYTWTGLALLIAGLLVALSSYFILNIIWLTALGIAMLILSLILTALGSAIPRLPPEFSALLLETSIANIDAINDTENNNLFSYLILRHDKKIVSRGLASKGPRPKMLSVRPPAPDLTYLKSYVAAVAKLAKQDGYEILESFLGPEDYNKLDIFAEAGFTLVGVINYYVKKL